MPGPSVEAKRFSQYELLQPDLDNNDLSEYAADILGYSPFLEDRETPEFYLTPTNQDPVLLDPNFQGEPFLKRFDWSMPQSFESSHWSIDDILADCTPEKTALWSEAISDEELLSKNLSSSSFSTPSVTRVHYYATDFNQSPDNYTASDPLVPSYPSPTETLKPAPSRAGSGKVSKRSAKKSPRGKKSGKFNFVAKKASLQKLVSELQLKAEVEKSRDSGILVRKNVAKELAIAESAIVPCVKFEGVDFKDSQQFLNDQALQHQLDGQFRTIWNYHRDQQGPEVFLTLSLADGKRKYGPNDYQFSVISRHLPYNCFGRPQAVSKKKLNKVQEELEREHSLFGENAHCWRHFVTSFEYFKLVNFMLGQDYDFNLNDNQAGETRGSDGKVISPEKRHDMRTRSHAKIYFEGKAVKSAHELLHNETTSDRKSFIVGTFGQIMGYTYKKPYGSDSSLSVMEYKYLEEALQKEINFHIFHRL